MRTEKKRVLRDFCIRLDSGKDAVLSVSISDQLIKQIMLLNYEQKAPKKAKELQISSRTFNRYQSGETAPTLRKAVKLLDSLGYDMIIRKRHE